MESCGILKFGTHGTLDRIIENYLQKELGIAKPFWTCQMLGVSTENCVEKKWGKMESWGILEFWPHSALNRIIENYLQKELGFGKDNLSNTDLQFLCEKVFPL